jgi:hypothetical protein
MAEVRTEAERRPVAHRAVDDAAEERRRWLDVCRLAREKAVALRLG